MPTNTAHYSCNVTRRKILFISRTRIFLLSYLTSKRIKLEHARIRLIISRRCFPLRRKQTKYSERITTRRIKIARFSIGIFSVFSNDKNKNYDTIWSAWEFAKNREQPEVYGLIRLEVMLLQSKDIKRWVVKRVWKKIHPITLRDKHQSARWLAFAE